MSKLFLFVTIVVVALAGGSLKTPGQTHLLTEEQVSEINIKADTWTADYNLVEGMTKEQALSKLGTFLISSDYPEADWGALIENFQAPLLGFGASEALSDRYCIKGNKILFSPQYLVSCDHRNYGCQGGYLGLAWDFLENTGIPSDHCVSYKSGKGETGTCPSTCDDGSPLKLYKAMTIKSFSNVSSIQLELMTNGPIEVAFTVYNDFMSYKSGIYKHVTGAQIGGHAVKLVGWGQENGLNYWICANSWGTSWGEHGYFRIAFGECGIEHQGIAGVPAV